MHNMYIYVYIYIYQSYIHICIYQRYMYMHLWSQDADEVLKPNTAKTEPEAKDSQYSERTLLKVPMAQRPKWKVSGSHHKYGSQYGSPTYSDVCVL